MEASFRVRMEDGRLSRMKLQRCLRLRLMTHSQRPPVVVRQVKKLAQDPPGTDSRVQPSEADIVVRFVIGIERTSLSMPTKGALRTRNLMYVRVSVCFMVSERRYVVS